MTAAVTAPDRRQLRNFALAVGAMLALVFGLVLPWLWSWRHPVWPWIVAAVLSAWGLAAPMSLAPVHRAWMKVAEAIAWFNNRLILALVFFFAVLPVGLVLRLLGRDGMARRFERSAPTYRIKKTPREPRSLERPF